MNAAPVTKMEYWYFVVFNLFVIYNLIHSLLGCFQIPFLKERIKKQGGSRPINGERFHYWNPNMIIVIITIITIIEVLIFVG